MLNLHHIRTNLVKNFKNVNFAILEPLETLSYIKTLAKPTEEILLIYTEVEQTSAPKYEINTIINDNKTSKLDLTGTPLEDDCNIDVIDEFLVGKQICKTNDWSDEEETYSSVNLTLATDIVNTLNMNKDNKCESGSVFAICDGKSNDRQQFLLSIQYDENWNFRGVGKFIDLIPFTDIDISTLMKNHLACLRNCHKADTTIETRFDVKYNQTIKLSWSTTSLTPSIQHNKNAVVVLSQSIPVGNYESSIEEYWRQLELLEGIRQDIDKYKKNENHNDLVYCRCASSLPLTAIKEHIIEVLSNIAPFEMAKETDTFDIESVISRMETQRMLNVTDQLWNVLKFCSSYEDLLNSLHYIFRCCAQSIVVKSSKSDLLQKRRQHNSNLQLKMLNLHHIRTNLVKNFKNVNFAILEPLETLSYIKTLAKPTEEILLIYTEVEQTSAPKYEINTIINDNKTSKLDLTGTPLEDDCNIDVIDEFLVGKQICKTNDWSDEEETYSSVNLTLATDIVNTLNMNKDNKCESGSVFAICDGKSNDRQQFLLSIQYDENWNFRGVGKFIDLIPFTDIDISTLMKNHLACLRNCHKADTTIETRFDVKYNQTIKLSWSTTSLTPSIQHNKNAVVVLSQSIPVGNYESSIEEYWRQLELLEGIRQDIDKYKKNENHNDLVYCRCASSLPLTAIKEHIIEVLSNIAPFEMAKETDTFDIESVISRMETQRMLNVTDQLWNVLKFCSSYEDLLNSLHYIFRCCAQSIVVNMPTNVNRLACIIREISEKRLVIPRLSGSEPLEILLEIGIQKITKDYEHIFTESKICSSTAFQSFIQDFAETSAETVPINVRKTLQQAADARKTLMKQNEQLDKKISDVGFEYTHFDKVEIDRKFAKLAQIHLILEHMLLMQINLNLDNTVFGSIMSIFPKKNVEFARLKTMKYDKREFPIACSNILSKIENRNPHVIKICMKSENRFKIMENTYFYSVDPICPPNVFPYMQNSEEIVNRETLYCGLHYAKIGSSKR